MRLGVLDVGSNTIHLQVVDAHPGARPSPATSQKFELRLTDYLDSNNAISQAGFEILNIAITSAIKHAEEHNVEEILAFATSAIRESSNGGEIIEKLNQAHDFELQILTGDEEAAITFLAVRRWLGWSSGRLLVLDIGGGSLEMALGDDEAPEATISLPIGAARMTREYLKGDPYSSGSIKNLRSHVQNLIRQETPLPIKGHEAERFVATSKTFRTLARLTSHWYGDNPKLLDYRALKSAVEKLEVMSNKDRIDLPGVSQSRALQIVAGGIVASEVMERLSIREVEICPWALREGIVLKWLDWMDPIRLGSQSNQLR